MRRLFFSLMILRPRSHSLSLPSLNRTNRPMQPSRDRERARTQFQLRVCLELGRYERREACLGTTMP